MTAPTLQRRLGLWACWSIVTGSIIGSGIFRTPAAIATDVHSVGGIALLWIIGAVVTLCLGLCFAELATMFPQAGGVYVYLREAFGPGVAFVYDWTFLIVNPASWAAIAVVFGEYFTRLVPLGPDGPKLAASALVLFVTVANYVSLRFASAVQGAATAAKLLGLAALIIALFAWGDGAHGALAAPLQFSLPAPGATFTALLAVFFTYDGVANAAAAFGEARNPSRTVPLALLLGLLAVGSLYVATNAAYLYVLPLDVMARSPLVAADAVQRIAGPTGVALIAACVAISAFGAVASTAIADSRVFFAAAADRLFFARVGAIHPRYGTPHVAVSLSGALALAYLWIGSFEELAAQFILGLWPFQLLCVVGLIRLRRRRPDLPRPFRTPGFPLVPLVFIAAAALLLGVSFAELPRISLLNLAISLLGIPVYFLWRRWTPAPPRPTGE
jgi:amino acid transporter